MKITRIIITTGFLVILAVFLYYGNYFRHEHVSGILDLEFASAEKGRTILASWQTAGLLSLARRLTWIDFFFIFFYVAVIITLSNRQVRKEPSIAINALLRANFLVAVLIGLFDIAENVCLLYDMYHLDTGTFLSTRWIAWPKFILAGWAVLIWLVSFVKSRIN